MPVFSNKWTLVLLVILAGVLIWNHNRPHDLPTTPDAPRPLPEVTRSTTPSVAGTPPPVASSTPASPDSPATEPTAQATPPAPLSAPPAAAGFLPGSNTEVPAEQVDISEDLSAVDSAIRNYHAVHGENPVGSNAEITTALFINNPKQMKPEVPAGSRINADGQLCDRWGTPYFFHQVSGTEMEIRSAGPDRKMWTGDDSQM